MKKRVSSHQINAGFAQFTMVELFGLSLTLQHEPTRSNMAAQLVEKKQLEESMGDYGGLDRGCEEREGGSLCPVSCSPFNRMHLGGLFSIN